MNATIHQVNISAGGVPKLPIVEGVVGTLGISGDAQAKPGIHGGPYRALSLLALETIARLAAEGHPIAPGTTGENITTAGLDWSLVVPNARLHLGPDVVIEVTGYADPCPTIRGSFADANVNLLNYRTAPESRVYARVLREGTIRPGDTITIELPATVSEPPILAAAGIRSMNQVAIAVSDLDRSIAFYRENLGAVFTRVEPAWGLAWLDIGGVALMLEGPAHNKEATPGSTTIYFNVEDIDAAYQAMSAGGVQFDAPPSKQWEENGAQGWMAFLRDPDGHRLGIVSRVEL